MANEEAFHLVLAAFIGIIDPNFVRCANCGHSGHLFFTKLKQKIHLHEKEAQLKFHGLVVFLASTTNAVRELCFFI